jgi:hypothetical protein
MNTEEIKQTAAREQRAQWRVWLLTWGVWAAVALMTGYLGLLAYWRWGPIIPNITVHESYIRDLDDNEGAEDAIPTLHRPGVFQVTRRISAAASAETRVFVFFETPADVEIGASLNGVTTEEKQSARPSKLSFQIAEVIEHIERGTNWRSRVYETPRVLPPGDYVYRSVERYCNPLRCEDFPLPPVPVRLAGPAEPQR